MNNLIYYHQGLNVLLLLLPESEHGPLDDVVRMAPESLWMSQQLFITNRTRSKKHYNPVFNKPFFSFKQAIGRTGIIIIKNVPVQKFNYLKIAFFCFVTYVHICFGLCYVCFPGDLCCVQYKNPSILLPTASLYLVPKLYFFEWNNLEMQALMLKQEW